MEGLKGYVGKSLLIDVSSTNYNLSTAVESEKLHVGTYSNPDDESYKEQG